MHQAQNPNDLLAQLLTILFFVAIGAWFFKGRGAAGTVLASPFRFGGMIAWSITRYAVWALTEILRHVGLGLVRIAHDIHRYLYRRWPGATTLGYLILAAAGGLYVLLR